MPDPQRPLLKEIDSAPPPFPSGFALFFPPARSSPPYCSPLDPSAGGTSQFSLHPRRKNNRNLAMGKLRSCWSYQLSHPLVFLLVFLPTSAFHLSRNRATHVFFAFFRLSPKVFPTPRTPASAPALTTRPARSMCLPPPLCREQRWLDERHFFWPSKPQVTPLLDQMISSGSALRRRLVVHSEAFFLWRGL